MLRKFNIWRPIAYGTVGFLLLVAMVSSGFAGSHAGATQLASRSIQLSDSGPSGGTITTGVGSGTNVTYQVGFTTAQTAQSLVIDFCMNDPIIGDTCTAPAGMNAASATLTGVTGNIGTGWTVTAAASQVILEDSTGTAAAAGVQLFDLKGITNPSTAGCNVQSGTTNQQAGCSFYARIYTYAASNPATNGYTGPTTLGTYEDYGGVALTTVQVITITARVQETLTFCISGSNQTGWTTTHDCSDPNASVSPALILGHGSPTAILDSSAIDTGQVFSQLSTNATTGAVINMHNSNQTCGGLSDDGGATCQIPAIGSTSGTPTAASAMTAGTADFGLLCLPSTLDTNGSGTGTCAPTYYNSAHADPANLTTDWYGMNPTNVGSTYGDTVMSTTGPVYRIDNTYTFAATAALTTPAGIYTANMAMIATGTF